MREISTLDKAKLNLLTQLRRIDALNITEAELEQLQALEKDETLIKYT